VKTCAVCGDPLPEAASTGRPRLYCSSVCRSRAARDRQRTQREAAFVATYEEHYGRMPASPIGTVEELRQLLMTSVRLGSVTAAKILLDDLRRDGGGPPQAPDFIDELTRRRNR
jgi:predicted nucleic acid-binding Zn ribbon protein